MTTRQTIVVGLILGVSCALCVWYLERFESRRLITDVESYLARYDEFRDWLATNKGESSA